MKKHIINGKLIDKDEIEKVTEQLIAKEKSKKLARAKKKNLTN